MIDTHTGIWVGADCTCSECQAEDRQTHGVVMIQAHDHVLSWDGPKCRWICAVGECEYFVDDERFSATFLAAVSPERMQAVADQLERLVTGAIQKENRIHD